MQDEPEVQIHKIKEAPSIYSNVCLIRTTPEEVMLHFAQRWTDDPSQGDAVLTVYTNLWHAKRLAYAMLESISKYEAIFGEIPRDRIADIDPDKLKEMGISDDNEH